MAQSTASSLARAAGGKIVLLLSMSTGLLVQSTIRLAGVF